MGVEQIVIAGTFPGLFVKWQDFYPGQRPR